MNAEDSGHPNLPFGIVLLAAGASSRMGRPKLLLPWGSSTVLDHLLSQWQPLAPTQMAIVVATGDNGILQELDRRPSGIRTDRLFNPNPGRGMFSSIQIAAAWPGWDASITHWLISLGDQPLVRQETWRRLLAEGARQPHRICQPSRHGRPRHPVLMPARPFRDLAVSPEQNLKLFLAGREPERHCLEIDDPGLDLDLDFPADYEHARQLLD